MILVCFGSYNNISHFNSVDFPSVSLGQLTGEWLVGWFGESFAMFNGNIWYRAKRETFCGASPLRNLCECTFGFKVCGEYGTISHQILTRHRNYTINIYIYTCRKQTVKKSRSSNTTHKPVSWSGAKCFLTSIGSLKALMTRGNTSEVVDPWKSRGHCWDHNSNR